MKDDAILSSVYLFTALEPAQLARMRQGTHRMSLNDGEHLFEWRDEARRFFLVVNGQILLKRVTPDGQEKVIEIVRSGQTFAEAVMFMDVQTYPVTAVASGSTELLAFDNHVFKGLLVDSPETCFRLLADFAMRLHRWIREVDALTLQTATARTVNYLLYQLPDGATSPTTTSLPAPKHVVASRLSIKPETFSRILHDLSEANLIRVDGRTVHIHNIKELSRHGQWEVPVE